MEPTLLKKEVAISETVRTIYERRSVRKYRDTPVDRKVVEQIIAAGRMAPSAINQQAWKFYVVTDKSAIKAYSKEITMAATKRFVKSGIKGIVQAAHHVLHLAHGFNFHGLEDPVFHGAPVVIFITGPRNNEWAKLDIGMCAQNMMLAAKSMGLDSCPVGFGKLVEKTKLFPKLMIPASEEVYLSVILGYGNENPEVHERKTDNIIYID
jgi:nitroreductase